MTSSTFTTLRLAPHTLAFVCALALVGDIVTIILQETTQASKKAGTSFSKQSADNINAPNLLGKTFGKAAIGLGASNNFAGDATSTQQNALTGAITVIVQEVLPNGLLRVAGAIRIGVEALRQDLIGAIRKDLDKLAELSTKPS